MLLIVLRRFFFSPFILTYITTRGNNAVLLIMMPGALLKPNSLCLACGQRTPFYQKPTDRRPQEGEGRFLVEKELSNHSSRIRSAERWAAPLWTISLPFPLRSLLIQSSVSLLLVSYLVEKPRERKANRQESTGLAAGFHLGALHFLPP